MAAETHCQTLLHIHSSSSLDRRGEETTLAISPGFSEVGLGMEAAESLQQHVALPSNSREKRETKFSSEG